MSSLRTNYNDNTMHIPEHASECVKVETMSSGKEGGRGTSANLIDVLNEFRWRNVSCFANLKLY